MGEWNGRTPARHVVPPGTRLWRVHHRDEPADRLCGNVPVSERCATALAEWVLPRVSDGTSAPPFRWVGGLRLANMVASPMQTTIEIVLLRLLDERDIAAAGVRHERLPRRAARWANWFHDEIPDIAGMVWESPADLHHPTILLFGDRCLVGTLRAETDAAVRLDTRAGVGYLNRELADFGVGIPLPEAIEPLVFINYRSSDDRHLIDRLDKELCTRFGDNAVFRDDRSLGPGVEFAPELLNKVRGCKVLITVIGERWEDSYDSTGQRLLDRPSDWVRREIAEAIACGIHIVPVLVGARGWPDVVSLPDSIKPLAGRQYEHLPRRYTDENVRALVDRLVKEVPALGE